MFQGQQLGRLHQALMQLMPLPCGQHTDSLLSSAGYLSYAVQGAGIQSQVSHMVGPESGQAYLGWPPQIRCLGTNAMTVHGHCVVWLHKCCQCWPRMAHQILSACFTNLLYGLELSQCCQFVLFHKLYSHACFISVLSWSCNILVKSLTNLVLLILYIFRHL